MGWSFADLVPPAFGDPGEVLKDRLKKPFVAAFVISWSIVNHATLIAIVSDGDYAKKVVYINSLYSTPSDAWAQLLGLPLLGVLSYFLVVPLLNLVAIFLQDGAEVLYLGVQAWLKPKKFISKAEQAMVYAKFDERLSKLREEKNYFEHHLLLTRNQRDKVLSMAARLCDGVVTRALETPGFTWGAGDLLPVPAALLNGNPLAQQMLAAGGVPVRWVETALQLGDTGSFNIFAFVEKVGNDEEAYRALEALRAARIIFQDWSGEDLTYVLPAASNQAIRNELANAYAARGPRMQG
jgi:hypothetical protein